MAELPGAADQTPAPAVSRTQAVLLSIAMLAAFAAGDYVTGPFVGFDLFYLAPVIVLAWFHGRPAGFVMAFAQSIVWAAVLSASGQPHAHWAMWFWNIAMRFAMSGFIVWLLSRLKAQMAEQKRLIAELERAGAEIKQLGGLLPICAWCKKVRDDEGYWQQIEQFICEHTDATFTHGICPECARTLMESSPRHGSSKPHGP